MPRRGSGAPASPARPAAAGDRRAFVRGLLAVGVTAATATHRDAHGTTGGLWGDLDALERPKPLDKALRIIGGPPALGGEPWPTPRDAIVRLSAHRDHDGRPGDLLVLPPYRAGRPQTITNAEVFIKNFRRVRVVGLHLHVTSPFFGWRRQRHPDGTWIGPDGPYRRRKRLLNFTSDVAYLRDVDDVFIEGCHLQVDNDVPGHEVFPTGDGITAFGLGWSDDPLDRFVIQNTRIETMGTHDRDDEDNRRRDTAHSDAVQLQARVLLRKLRIQNFHAASNYQGLFFPRSDTEQRIDQPDFSPDGRPGWSPGPADCRFRRLVLWSPARSRAGSIHGFMAPGGPRRGLDSCHRLALLDDVHCGTPLGTKTWRTVVAPPALYENPDADAFREPARHVAAAPVTGTVNMFTALADAPDVAPADAVGRYYQSPWS
jgi:hypothetical protein